MADEAKERALSDSSVAVASHDASADQDAWLSICRRAARCHGLPEGESPGMREPMFKDVGVPSDEEFPDKIVFLPSTDSEELIRSESSAASGSGGFEYVSFKNVPAFRRLVGKERELRHGVCSEPVLSLDWLRQKWVQRYRDGSTELDDSRMSLAPSSAGDAGSDKETDVAEGRSTQSACWQGTRQLISRRITPQQYGLLLARLCLGPETREIGVNTSPSILSPPRPRSSSPPGASHGKEGSDGDTFGGEAPIRRSRRSARRPEAAAATASGRPEPQRA
mmetsp:Transcript_13253/g.38196  ORF Transcript_13253/g.38196 Transcript_13253/m.38196 type:complete len:279 (+) Transcript_13253:86-922(+)